MPFTSHYYNPGCVFKWKNISRADTLINQAIGTSKKLTVSVNVTRFKGTAKCFLQPQNDRIMPQYRRQIVNICIAT